jgi:hypothetical protein
MYSGSYVNSDITRNNPSCFLFLIDQSSSMAQYFGERPEGGGGMTKAEGVANALNNLLRNLVITCSRADGIRNYFDVGVIGYGERVYPAWGGALMGFELVPIRDVANHFARMEEKTITVELAPGETIQQPTSLPVWVEPVAAGSTPMCQAFRAAHDILSAWLVRNQSAHPPVIVHITDGEATDGNPAPLMSALTDLGTLNGKVVLFNVHLCGNRNAKSVSFPDTPDDLPDPFARMLFQQASLLTPFMRQVAWDNSAPVTENAKAFVLNADPTQVVLALEIGTRPGMVW